jgi:hypothetical protein
MDDVACSHRLISREHDAQAVHGVGKMVAKVKILPDGA